MNAPVGWGPVRTGMLLIGIAWLAWAGLDLVHQLIEMSELQKLRNSDTGIGDLEKLFDRILFMQKVFTALLCVAMIVTLVGTIGLARTPPPSSAGAVALVAVIACALLLVIEGGLLLLNIIDDKAKILKTLEGKPLWVIWALLAAAVEVLLLVAIHAAGRRAGQGGVVVLLTIACMVIGIVLCWELYFIIERPRWAMSIQNPGRALLLHDLPRITRDVLLGVTALVGAAQVRQARA